MTCPLTQSSQFWLVFERIGAGGVRTTKTGTAITLEFGVAIPFLGKNARQEES